MLAVIANGQGASDPNEKADQLKNAIKDLFMEIDEDGSGDLDIEELSHVFEKIGVEASEQELEDIMTACGAEPDEEGETEVNFSQFSSWMMSTHPKAVALRHNFSALDDLVDDDEIAKAARKGKDKFMFVAPGDPLQTVFVLLEEPDSGKLAKFISLWIQALVVVSTTTFITETLEAVKADRKLMGHFVIAEWVCIVHFTAEYVVRVLCCTHRPGDDQGVFSYLVQPMNLVDVAAVSPAYLELIFGAGGNIAVLRILRVIRIFRILKLVPSLHFTLPCRRKQEKI